MKQKELEKYAKKYGSFLIIALLFIVTIVPLLLRGSEGHPVTPGIDSYSHLRHADLLLDGMLGYDPLRMEQIFTTPYIVVLAIFRGLGLDWVLGPLLGWLFVWMLYLVLKRKIRQKSIIYVALMALIASPVFSVMTTGHNPVFFSFVLMLGTLIFRHKSLVLTAVLLAIASATAPLLGLLFGLFLIAGYLRKKNYQYTLGILLALVVPLIWQMIWMGFIAEIPRGFTFSPRIIFEIGDLAGISIFYAIVALYGVYTKRLPEEKTVFWSTLGLVVLSMVIPEAILIATAFLAYLIAYAVFDLLIEKWNLELLRAVVLILIVCIGLLTTTVAVKDRVSDLPNERMTDIFTEIGAERHGGAVLAHPDYAPIVEYFSGRSATLRMDSDDVDKAFLTRDPVQVYNFLEDTRTGYIYIDEYTMSKTFSRTDEGILFVLPNTKRFVNLADTGTERVWYYIRR